MDVEECANDLAALPPVPVIWQNCLNVDSVPLIWQRNCLYVEKQARKLSELPAMPVIWLVPVIWQNYLCQ